MADFGKPCVDEIAEGVGVGELGGDFVVLGDEAIHGEIDIEGGGTIGVEVGGIAGGEVSVTAILGALDGLDDVVDEMDASGSDAGALGEVAVGEVIGDGGEGEHAKDGECRDAAEQPQGCDKGRSHFEMIETLCLWSISDATGCEIRGTAGRDCARFF